MKIIDYFPFEPDAEKIKLIKALEEFLNSSDEQVFVLTGYAGSGKTTVLKALTSYFIANKRQFQLMASTGRAAKILRDKTGVEATTVHLGIYSFQSHEDKNGFMRLIFVLAPNFHDNDAVYIVDEASMISNRENQSVFADFGSGKLLSDIFGYARGRKIIFVGDLAQLPPVNSNISPALEPSYLSSHFGVKVRSFNLRNIHRQAGSNDIYSLIKTFLRIFEDQQHHNRRLNIIAGKKGHDIKIQRREHLMINEFCRDYELTLNSSKIMLALSNNKVNSLNYYARQILFNRPDTLEVNDIMMCFSNNYTYNVLNGDTVRIVNPDLGTERKAGLTFRKCELEVERMGRKEHIRAYVLLDLISRDKPSLSLEEEKGLMIDFSYRMRDMGIKKSMKKEWLQALISDPYLNAFRLRYGYAVTCHKAQGGEWDNLFLFFEWYFDRFDNDYQHRWAYTAVTRAKKRLYLLHNDFIR